MPFHHQLIQFCILAPVSLPPISLVTVPFILVVRQVYAPPLFLLLLAGSLSFPYFLISSFLSFSFPAVSFCFSCAFLFSSSCYGSLPRAMVLFSYRKLVFLSLSLSLTLVPSHSLYLLFSLFLFPCLFSL